MNERFFQKVCFRLRLDGQLRSAVRRAYWHTLGCSIGRATRLSRLRINWPHQLVIGSNCILEEETAFKWDGFWQPGPSIFVGDNCFIGRGCEFNIKLTMHVGDHCLIASGCKFIDHDHGVPPTDRLVGGEGPEAPIQLHPNVWLGVNVVVLKGVTIGRGAVVGAGAVVNKSIPEFEIWAGVPAKRIGIRPARGAADATKVGVKPAT